MAGSVRVSSDRVLRHEVGFPDDLAEIVSKAEYKPGWSFRLEEGPRRQGGSGLNLVVDHACQNT